MDSASQMWGFDVFPSYIMEKFIIWGFEQIVMGNFHYFLAFSTLIN